jgi:hypothetical protein
MPVSPYYTASQKLNANGMDTVAQSIEAQFVVGLGDNFYKIGITDDDAIVRYTHSFDEVSCMTAI